MSAKRLKVDERRLLYEAIANARILFKYDVARDGVEVRETDLTFSVKLRRNTAIKKARLDEFVKIVNSVRESFVKLEYNEQTFVASMENKYPEDNYKRRAERAKSGDDYWTYLDLDSKDAKIVTAKVMWSNELQEIPAFDESSVVSVNPELKRLQILKIRPEKNPND